MERGTQNQEFRFSRAEQRPDDRQPRTGKAPEEGNETKIQSIIFELKDLERVPAVALILPAVPKEPERRKKSVLQHIATAIAWIIRRLTRPPDHR